LLKSFLSKSSVAALLFFSVGHLGVSFAAAPAQVVPPPVESTDNRVIVIGERPDCDGILSETCGWGDAGGGGDFGGGGGGGGSESGGGGGGGGGFLNDQSAGSVLNHTRFAPGCILEAAFMAETVASVESTGAPVGRVVEIDIQDPLYLGGDWTKYETETIQTVWKSGDGLMSTKKRVRVHYM
jgi:hypothetical protein